VQVEAVAVQEMETTVQAALVAVQPLVTVEVEVVQLTSVEEVVVQVVGQQAVQVVQASSLLDTNINRR
jgi:hypothetical protein